MKKEDALKYLRDAKASHVKWVQRAKMLINGVEIEKDAIPVNSTECKFGIWFYDEGQKLNSLSNNPLECMTNIEKLHFELHDIYFHIFHIYFNKPKKGLLAKLFGQKKDVTAAELNMAKDYYAKLELVSEKLLDEINRLERRLIAVPDDKTELIL
jgi:hypothetical protein